MKRLLFAVVTVLLLLSARCGEGKNQEKILLLPRGYFELKKGESIQPIDSAVEARYACVFNTAPELVQCPLYRRMVTKNGQEFFLAIILDTTIRRAMDLPILRDKEAIDTLATDSLSYVWYRYARNGFNATAFIYVHQGRVPYLLGSTDLTDSACFTIDSLSRRFVAK